MSVATTNPTGFEVICRGDDLWRVAKSVSQIGLGKTSTALYIRSDWKEIRQQSKRDLYIIMSEGLLGNETERLSARQVRTGGAKRFLLLPDESPRESLFETILKLNVRSQARVHTPRLEVDDLKTFVERFLYTLESWPAEQKIVDAWLENDKLVVLAPTFERLRVPVKLIPKVCKATSNELNKFDIDDHGEFIYWPSHDVHMGWSQFEQAARPQAKLRAQQRSEEFNRKYGAAIRRLRAKMSIRQSDIKGLDERTVRRIEHGKTRAAANSLAKLANAHDMSTNEYLSALADELAADV